MLFRQSCFLLRSSPSASIFRRNSSNYYDVLKLPQSCTTKDIRDAFISLSKQNHPDRHLNDPSMHERFVRINEAYSVLINPSKRRAYDISLEHSRKLQPPSDVFRNRGYSSSYSTVESTSPHYTSYSSGFKDNSFWEYRDKSQDAKFENESYYGIKGVRKVSNGTILGIIFVFTVFGVFLQLIVITKSVERTNGIMEEKNKKLMDTYNRVRAMALQRDNKQTLAYLLETVREGLEEDRFEVEPILKPAPCVISIDPINEVLEVNDTSQSPTEQVQHVPQPPTPKREVISTPPSMNNLLPEPL